MTRHASLLLATVLTAVAGCGSSATHASLPARDSGIAAAEALIDAFYAFDSSELGKRLQAATPESRQTILFYQGWAEGGNYQVLERRPCVAETPELVRCSIMVKDDLIGALELPVHVTDTFHIRFANGVIAEVSTTSDDPPLFHEALAWVRAERASLVAEPCRGFFAGGPTPGACVRAVVQGFREFTAQRR